ncbi:RsmB/NOP family class I SAM-dependent RNA methyltransferase [Uliginosibacterium sp. H1]|uniref:RsmB/NOP family class I SAM-dependent RNA methyltransferase n=1 Tax=Uliginosibacterium sp. H1 TaxID=3114757 RepID=UPI002E190926|nr:methyltransferase domain-containing protein [Uliginosibacterium sp. H1]
MTIEKITTLRLDAATEALTEVLRFQYPADGVLSNFFRNDRKLGQRDRAFVAEAVYGVLRRMRRVRIAAGEGNVGPRKLVLAWLARFEGYSLRQLEPVLSRNEIEEWFPAMKAVSFDDLSIAERCDLPDWLATRLQAQLGDEGLLALADALNRPAPLDIRVNTMKTERDIALAQLKDGGFEAEAGRYSPVAIRFADKPALQKHPLFLDGAIEVQDEGSQLLAYMLAPKRSEMVADFCAGAGGKTMLLGALMRSTGRLYAFDVSEKRLARMKPRVARSGLSNVHPAAIAHEHDARIKRLAGKLDRVLVDAPCSGFGTLRRNPDLKWRQTEQDVVELTAKQASILAAAASLVKPGGRLVYATCSLLAEENDSVVDAFLAAHPQFAPLPVSEALAGSHIALDTGERLRLDPVTHGTDGFFAAAFVRKT